VEFTPAFWMILGLTLVLGWVLGLMSRSGGKKWKLELERERKDHQAAIRNRDAQIEALKARTAELERSRPATAYRSDAEVHDSRADLRYAPRESALDKLDLTRRGRDGDGYADHGPGGYRQVDDDGRTVIRPSRP
jgi:uncharacterized membrane-anchored protein YhcB (DUF1043 family)